MKMILVVLLLTTANAKSPKWQTLKTIKAYRGSDYHLKADVSYMEIRWYASKKSKKVTNLLKLYKKPLESYPKETISKFKSLKPKYSNRADIGWSGNAFFINTKGKMYQMDMKKDIFSLLGKIDKPAEIALVLYLNNVEGKHYYKKISNGYKIKSIEKLKACTNRVEYGRVNKNGTYTPAEDALQRIGCKKRKKTKFIHNKKVNYESYNKIVLDSSDNLYILAMARRSKSHDDYIALYLLEKYNTAGKRVWSKKLKTKDANGLLLNDKSIYVFNGKKPVALFLLNGKREHLKNRDIANRSNSVKSGKYSLEGLPNKKEAIEFSLWDYAKDKRGNTYIVGSEVFYPSGSSKSIPDGQCGNSEEILGALVAKLDSRGKTIWAKVIDRDE